MAKCDQPELDALNEAGPLLRFAAERVKNLDPDLSLAIAEARAAAENDQWSPQISQRFWSAFAKLCDLILPVTMDCLAAGHRNISGRRWMRFGLDDKISVAERSSSRYLIFLIFLLVFILPLQLYVWTCTNLSKKIDELIVADLSVLPRFSEDYRRLNAATTVPEGATPHQWTAEEYAADDKIVADSASLNAEIERILHAGLMLEKISTVFLGSADIKIKEAIATPWWRAYQSATERLSQARIAVLKIQEKSNLVVGIFVSFILPILFGTIGAVAYVIRTISDQVRTSTFSQSSPIRHLMRVALGAMAGVVIGLFNGLSSQLSLSPLALAFLAGYGVEAVFSMFDGFVDKFRQPRPDAKSIT